MKKRRSPKVAATGSVAEALDKMVERVVAGEEMAGPPVNVSLVVTGGAPKERLLESVEVDSNGSVTCEAMNLLRKKKQRKSKIKLDSKQTAALFRKVKASRLTEARTQRQEILPDSVVGILTICSGDFKETVAFPVDEREALEAAAADAMPLETRTSNELCVRPKAIPKRLFNLTRALLDIQRKALESE